MSNYKLASINVRGKLSIAHQVKNLERYITMKDFDIVTIQESNLLPKDEVTFARRLRTYSCYFDSNRSSRHQGIIILIRKSLQPRVISFHTSTKVFGRVGLVTLRIGSSEVAIVNLYLPAGYQHSDNLITLNILSKLDIWLKAATVRKAQVVIMGDWNCNMFDRTSRHAVRRNYIRSLLDRYDIPIIENNVPTWVSEGKQSIIDHVASTIPTKLHIDTETELEIETDHRCVSFEITNDTTNPFCRPTFHLKSKETIENFNKEIERQESDGSINNWIRNVEHAAHNTLPKNDRNGKGVMVNKYIKKLNKAIKESLQERHARIRNSEDTTEINELIQSLRREKNQETKHLQHARAIEWTTLINKGNSKLVYRIARPRNSTRSLTTLNDEGTIVTKPEDLKLRVKEKFADCFQRAPTQELPLDLIQLLEQKRIFKEASDSITSEVTLTELTNMIKNLKHSAAGIDGLSSKLFKSLSVPNVTSLAQAISNLLQGNDTLDAKYRNGFIVLISKEEMNAQNNSDLLKFRPITILPLLYRIIMNIVNNRIQ
jgi:predicted RNA-binding protein YlxR (DUF448 family)